MGATENERQPDIQKYTYTEVHGEKERAREGPIEIVACAPDRICQGYVTPGPVWEPPRTRGNRIYGGTRRRSERQRGTVEIVAFTPDKVCKG